jgi:biotin carboxyl carrier protein
MMMGNSSQRVVVIVNGQEYVVEIGDLTTTPVTVVVDGHTYEVVVEEQAAEAQSKPTTTVSMPQVENSHQEIPEVRKVVNAASESRVLAPLPGDIVDVNVQPGQHVGIGDSLCVIDAMKMRNEIRSPREGQIADVEVSIGQAVDYGDVLITFE